YIQDLHLIERICGICSHAHTTCYTQAVEEALKVDLPPRAKYIRTVVAELERIHNHYFWLGILAHEIGFDTLFMYTWRDREIVMNLLELISGNRVQYAMNIIGGVRRDIMPSLSSEIMKGVKILAERMTYYKKVCLDEKTILARCVNVGVLKAKDAISLCAVGPTLRASNVRRDVRADDPYAAYDEIPFHVVTYDGCDVASRIATRCDEVLESVKIIRYALEHLPTGSIEVIVSRVVPSAETIARVEAPRGENIHYLRSNGTDKPARYKVRAPTLANLPALCRMLIGGYVADIPVVIAGIDPCFCCMDRLAFADTNTDKTWSWEGERLRKYGVKWYKKK
ncbi:MAG: nickel-dependent hydrogenase large subunit, partial [Candidatus Bathyarchaeota archaeon]